MFANRKSENRCFRSAKDIVFQKAVPVPPSAKVLLATLQKALPVNKSTNN